MKRHRRWLSALLAATIMAASHSVSLAAPAASPFADFRIDASDMDVAEREITVDIYRPDENGQFSKADTSQYLCKLNRVTEDTGFFIQASGDGVWVTVDYLTDLNGDGVYEFLEDSNTPAWDVMDIQGALARPQAETESISLTPGRLYILAPETLVVRSQQAVQSRSAGGDCALDVGQGMIARQESPLCMVRLHRTDPADGQDYEQTYYLQLYKNVLIPYDVSPSEWYYDAVEFVLERGYFVGAGKRFLPEEKLTRAQLAQVLWAVGGRQEADLCNFADVSPDAWFCQAVSWCQKEKLITGYTSSTFAPNDPLSREQMVTVLYRYARYAGSSLLNSADLSAYSDSAAVSSWAVTSMRWAVSNGLISNPDNTLDPGAVVSRAELADFLYSYDRTLGLDP